MSAAIESYASCEVRAVIRFLCAKNHKPIEIYRQICEVYGQGVMSEGRVRQWCIDFKNGRTNIHNEERSGRPTVVTDELVAKINEKVRENRRFTITELSEHFPQISRSLVHEIVVGKLGYHKFCARWVPKLLTEDHKQQRLAAALNFLEAYEKNGNQLLERIVTGDETWVQYVNCETKRQSMEWGHTNSPNKPTKCLPSWSGRKIMATVFWDIHGVILVDFLERGQTINAERYCETLRKLRRAIQNKRRGKLSEKVLLIHDNARPHTAIHTRELLEGFRWEVFDHPPYSPDLAPSDFHLFPAMKTWLATQRFDTDEELHSGVNQWLKSQAADFYREGIEKLVPRYDKCLNLNGNYVEK